MISIIGANSFIGRNLALALKEESVALCAKDFSGFDFERIPHHKVPMDFSDPSTYIAQIKQSKTLVLLINSGSEDIKNYEEFLTALNEVEHAVEHIIYASSGGTVYGEGEGAPLKEDHPKNPRSSYGHRKLEIEKMLIEYSKNTPWKTTILRIANPVGLWGKKLSLVSAAIAAAKSGEALKLWAEESYIRDYFAVQDLCEAVKILIQNPSESNKIYNLGSGQGRSIYEILEIIGEMADKHVILDKQTPKSDDVSYNVLDCSRIKEDLGWEAKIDIRDTIKEMWAHI